MPLCVDRKVSGLSRPTQHTGRTCYSIIKPMGALGFPKIQENRRVPQTVPQRPQRLQHAIPCARFSRLAAPAANTSPSSPPASPSSAARQQQRGCGNDGECLRRSGSGCSLPVARPGRGQGSLTWGRAEPRRMNCPSGSSGLCGCCWGTTAKLGIGTQSGGRRGADPCTPPRRRRPEAAAAEPPPAVHLGLCTRLSFVAGRCAAG